MKNFRKLSTALALSMFIGAGMVTFSPTLHAAGGGSAKSTAVRCALLQGAIDAAIATFGAESELAIYLSGLYASTCGEL
jgi:hypothetical protein